MKKHHFIIIVTVLIIGLAGCEKETGKTAMQDNLPIVETSQWEAEYVVPHEADLDVMAISHEIDVYIESFTALYTNNTLDDTAPTMVIEEQNFPSNNDNGACLTIYSDLSGKHLRYKLTYYGETGNQVINYYLCENFVWISRQSNYYSSWILTDGYSDILYSEIDNWIVMDETVYIMHDNGELEKTEKAQLDVPLPETFTATEK